MFNSKAILITFEVPSSSCPVAFLSLLPKPSPSLLCVLAPKPPEQDPIQPIQQYTEAQQRGLSWVNDGLSLRRVAAASALRLQTKRRVKASLPERTEHGHQREPKNTKPPRSVSSPSTLWNPPKPRLRKCVCNGLVRPLAALNSVEKTFPRHSPRRPALFN